MSNAQDKQFNNLLSLYGKNTAPFGDWLKQNWSKGFSGGFNQSLYDTYNGMWNKNNPVAMASQPQTVATTPTEHQGEQQMDYNTLLNNLNTSIGNMDNRANEQYENANKLRNQSNESWMQMMQRLMDKEDNLSSGNPFIDMMQGYIRYKQRSNPNYQFGGLLGLFKRKPNNASFQMQQYDDSNNIG